MPSVATNGRKLCGRFTLIERLGAGGQGEVWRARDESRGVELALKILSPALARNEAAWSALVREHEVASRLDHPSILKVYPPQRDGETALLPMELAAGGDLRRLRGVSYLEIVPVLMEIAHALAHAHERGIVHRDLKPSNVLFDSNGRVRLADFGVAAGTALISQRDAVRSGMSPFTASPEQLRGEPPAISDDIYGLGALAYELLSGYPPYYPKFDLKRVLEEPVPQIRPVHQAPPRLIALVMAMLAKRPHVRPRSMREVLDDLDATLNDTLTFDFAESDEPDSVAAAATRKTPPEPLRTIPEPGRPAAAMPPQPAPSAAGRATEQRVAPEGATPHPPRVGAEALVADRVTEPGGIGRPAPLAHGSPAAPSLVAQRAGSVPRAGSGFDVAPEIAIAAGPTLGEPGLRDIKIEAVPSLMRLEPMPRRRVWPWVVLVVLLALAGGAFYWLPQVASNGIGNFVPALASTLPASAPPSASTPAEDVSASEPAPAADTAADNAAAEERMRTARDEFDTKLAALDARDAGVWGGKEYAEAKARAAEAVGAYDAGNPSLAEQRLREAIRLLGVAEGRAPQALAAQIAAGERALDAGDAAAAKQAFEFAARIDPNDQRAANGLRRANSLDEVLPLLAQAANAEAAKEYERAARAYNEALARDPENEKARSGLARANAALNSSNYDKAVGAGVAALGAGRLSDARAAFEKARSLRPDGREALDGLNRVNTALRQQNYAAVRARAASLEAEERWSEALAEYEAVLKVDPSLSFAQQGRARTAARAELGRRLQALIDNPQRLASEAVRSEALSLLDRADSQNPIGPVLRSQMTRLKILLPEFDKPVRLALESDNSTQVAIQRVGSFGTFSRREIELKPGKYTVVGTRAGYRDVRRDVTIAPGQEIQIISVRCVDPI